jgi:hypothetical protein
MGTRGLFPWGYSRQDAKLTINFHLVPRSRMLGAMPLHPQYAFMEWCSIKAQGQFLQILFEIFFDMIDI